MAGVLDEELLNIVSNCKVILIGAGGIGCELLKDLVTTGFNNIDIFDLDTIDVSNLNRQFLFQKRHIGQSKAEVAKQSALQINPDAKITAYHDSIMSSMYGVDFFKQYSIVLNALDNHSARSHVNRMCLAANIPLIDSGTAGYFGQVDVFKKSLTGCYECQPHGGQKTFPGCTIRNTPSEPIHCIVWAKHLFNQLFGEADPDEDVSPDTADPEATGEAGLEALNVVNVGGNLERVSTRSWAVECGYDSKKLFRKLFNDDIKYLLSMDRLWQTRRAPVPLDGNNLPDAVAGPSSENDNTGINDQRIWSIEECSNIFHKSVKSLKEQLDGKDSDEFLIWDKDNGICLDFVTACANIRAYIFGIPQESRFSVKSLAGNIIPAIATTNAVIAGLVVMETLKVLQNCWKDVNSYFLNPTINVKGKYIVPGGLLKKKPNCYVCTPKPEVFVKLNVNNLTVHTLENKILKGQLNMVSPDVEIDDGKGTILISSDGDTVENSEKKLGFFGIGNGTRLKCDDFHQDYELVVNVVHVDNFTDEGIEFEVVGEIPIVEMPKVDSTTNGEQESIAGPSSINKEGDDDDLIIMDNQESISTTQKRKLEATDFLQETKKMRKDDDNEIIICE